MDNLESNLQVPSPISMAKLFKTAFDGHDLRPLRLQTLARIEADPHDAAALLNLSVIEQLLGNREAGLHRQSQALALERLYRSPWPASSHALRVLAFKAPGDVGTNTPIEFLLEGADVVLYTLYVVPGQPIPNPLPDHDIAIVTPCESDQNRIVLREIERLISDWPRPVLNQPRGIYRSSRENLYRMLQTIEGIAMASTVRVPRTSLENIGIGAAPVCDFLSEAAFPLIARPIDSHAGRSLVKLDEPSSIAPYLASQPEQEFFISRFVDYRSTDGLFRKYRVMLVDGRPYPCHMAISDDWKVWYYNADMALSAAKRDEESRFMETFHTGFAQRHSCALAAIPEKLGLEYFGIDCAETPDGKLLLFEGGVDLVAHDMDRPEVYPYKGAHMQSLFGAFRSMLQRRSVRSAVPV
jgi:hypothetical protein